MGWMSGSGVRVCGSRSVVPYVKCAAPAATMRPRMPYSTLVKVAASRATRREILSPALCHHGSTKMALS